SSAGFVAVSSGHYWQLDGLIIVGRGDGQRRV
ncbi:MAG: hypothetical protein JWL84_5881, partial [Rhodospirillales bacterium]|nr:hypothetical protein [Rhodospirillales bacterium]